ncbi:NAD(+) synthase [Halanaerocella petrolearia]
MLDRDYTEVSKKLAAWIEEQVTDAGCEGAVVGLSGGIDSAVTSVLCKKAFPDNVLGLIMPCYSNPQDAEDAKKVAEKFDIPYQVIDLSDTFDQLQETIGIEDSENLAVANMKPRLRMTTLYYYASQRNSLVVGTDNRSELKLGYFTKYGDGGIDLAPLGNLVKSEVREVAKELDIPKKIITKAPSAGLWEGQTDEDELGITYEEVDNYILTGEARSEVKEIVDSLAARNGHKLQLPPIPEL